MSLLVLVHHGDAVGPDVDPMRPLSSVGSAATERLAAVAAARGVKPDVDLAQRETSCATDRESCSGKRAIRWRRSPRSAGCSRTIRHSGYVIVSRAKQRAILIVGHMPYLPRLLALMTAHARGNADRISAARMRRARNRSEKWKEIWRLEG